ncbi:hypothetical protein RF11_08210 [Thelohanellus kitauei]|uniref:Uncharacterized protein n=1 Tax=Thelohanellus kitauei TaxID=669202 RepID=A0A0C2J7Q2_THEKT|nr:hypothetical protein RF11_08210 [Thelohanellus kitauei]
MDRSGSLCDKRESINIEPLSLKLNKRIILERRQSFISTNKKGSTHGGQSDCVIEMPIPHKDDKSDYFNQSHYDDRLYPDRSDNKRGNKSSAKIDRSVSFCNKRESINIEPFSVELNKRIMQRNQSFISTKKERSSHDNESDSDIEMLTPPKEPISDFSSGKRVYH